ncbi:MAG: type IV pilus biogenesis/stability protein PilW, partial [Gammaproteobacteria bacterium]
MSRLIVFALMLTLVGCIATTDNPKPNKASDDDAALYNTQLGVQYMRQGKLERAMEKFQRALE